MHDSFVSLLDLPGQRQPLDAVVCPSLTAVIQAQVFAGLSLFSSDRCYHCAGNCHSSSGLIVFTLHDVSGEKSQGKHFKLKGLVDLGPLG